MKKRIIVVNGIHGAGKSSLAEDLVQHDRRFVFFPEIGRQVRSEVTYNALESGEPFDRVVMTRELARDEILLKETAIPIVETWHIGNIAYLHARTPRLIDEYKEHLQKKLEMFDPFCFFITIDWNVFRLRATEQIRSEEMESLIAFYKIIRDSTLSLYEDFGLSYRRFDNQSNFSAKVEDFKKEVARVFESDGL